MRIRSTAAVVSGAQSGPVVTGAGRKRMDVDEAVDEGRARSTWIGALQVALTTGLLPWLFKATMLTPILAT